MKFVRITLCAIGILALALLVSSLAVYLAFLILVLGLFYSWIYPTVFGLIVGWVALSIARRFKRRPRAYEIDTTLTKAIQ